MIHHFQYCIRLNKRRKKNFKEGRTWTYQTVQEVADHFPYWTLEEVRTILERLTFGKNRRGKGDLEFSPVLMRGNFNRTAFDKTVWYAFVDEDFFLNSKNVYERADAQMEMGGRPNGNGSVPTPIPNPKTDTEKDDPPLTPQKQSSRKVQSAVEGMRTEPFTEEERIWALNRIAALPKKPNINLEAYIAKMIMNKRELEGTIGDGEDLVEKHKKEALRFDGQRINEDFVSVGREGVEFTCGRFYKFVKFALTDAEWKFETARWFEEALKSQER